MSANMSDGELRTGGASRRLVYDAFIPLFLLALSLALWFGFQAVQLMKERSAMAATIVAQEKIVQDAKKLRDALDTIARETALLADAGNQNAKLIVDELRKRGVTINTTPPDSPAIPAK